MLWLVFHSLTSANWLLLRVISSPPSLCLLNAFHDMIAAISAYISLVEHVLVLALAFSGFDPAKDDLTDVIGLRWGDKFDRLLGKEGDAARYRQRLTDVVERWRNLYSHGGFEKGHGATIYLHTPGVGAVPVGLTSVRSSPLFSFIPAASETDITQVLFLISAIESFFGRLRQLGVYSQVAECSGQECFGIGVEFARKALDGLLITAGLPAALALTAPRVQHFFKTFF